MSALSSGVVAIMALGSLAAGIGMCVCLWRDHCLNLHKLLSVVSITLIGISMMMFRMLRTTSTRFVKYLHMLLHTLAIVAFLIGFIPNATFGYSIATHTSPGYFIMLGICVQYLTAFIIFIYMHDSPRLRLTFAPFHDIVGLWLYICLMGCAIGAFYDYTHSKYTFEHRVFNICGFVGGMLVVLAVLSPCFEWELRGFI